MAEPVTNIMDWLKTLDKDDKVGIDEGGLTLQSVNNPNAYYEIGGIPEQGDSGPPYDAATATGMYDREG